MFASRAMISIGMILIGVQFLLKENWAETIKIYVKDKVLFLLSFIFFVYFFGIIYSENMEEFWRKLVMKLPLLFMPLGFAALKEMSKKYFHHVLYAFVILSFITAAISVGIFIIDYSAIIESYKYAKVTPNIFNINHIRFSIMLVLAIFSAGYLIKENYFLVSKYEKYALIFMAVFIFTFLHILSVRSGLLAFYATCFVITIASMFIYKKYLIGTAVLLLIIIMPILAYFTIPTIQNKINYMALDISRFLKGEDVNHWSDGNRLLSLKIGLKVGTSNPIVGVGVGDVFDEMCYYYKKNHPEVLEKFRLIPHNQFLYVFAASGVIGLILFLYVSFFPFFLSITYRSIVFLALLVSILSSYISEATLENQLGVCLFITFYLIGWHCKPESKTEQL